MLVLMALVWGGHFAVLKASFGGAIDPIFYAAMRMTIVAIILSPLLRIHKNQMRRILIAGICLGGLNYAFMFSGISYTNASVSAVTMQLYAPIVMVFSVIFLQERVGLPRILSFALAFFGIVIIYSAKETDGMGKAPLFGMMLLIAAAITEAVGSVVIKGIHGVKPFQLLAWFALAGSVVLWTATLLFEVNQLAALDRGRIWRFLPALVYSIVFASLFSQATYYWLLSRLPVNLVACSTLLVALFAVLFGALFLSEPITWQLLLGGALTLGGVGTILVRTGGPESASDTPVIAKERW